MTLVRRKALEISSWVTWLASPGCKEWAEGSEREAAVIESDWAAVRWAIGSTCILLDRREAPMTSLDDVPAAAQKFFGSLAARLTFNSGYKLTVAGVIASAFLLSMTFLDTSMPLATIGALLLSGTMIWSSIYLRDRVQRPPQSPLPSDPSECALSLRSALQLYLELSYGRAANCCFAVFVVGMFLVEFAGKGLGQLAVGAPMATFYFLMWGIFLPLRRRADRLKRQNQIANLDALLAEKHGVTSL